jgi:replicative DNA helicase
MSSMIETTDAVLADLNAERQVLGILIKYPREVDSVIDQLRPHHFYDLAHRRVYEILYPSV